MTVAKVRTSGGIVDRDLGWGRLLDVARTLRGGDCYAKVGVLASAEKPSDDEPEFTMASLAAVQEFGSADGRIPARPFIRGGIDDARDELLVVGKRLAGGIYDGKVDVEKALNIMGMAGATAVKKYVTEGDQVPPPNAPRTIALKLKKGAWNNKGRNRKPVDAAALVRTLIDTGRMIGSVTWAVVIGGSAKQLAESTLGGAARRVS